MAEPLLSATAVPIAAGVASLQAIGGRALLRGWAFAETTGTAGAEVDLFDGASTAGILLAPIALAAGESTRDFPTPGGIVVERGLFVSVASGTLAGVVYIVPETRLTQAIALATDQVADLTAQDLAGG